MGVINNMQPTMVTCFIFILLITSGVCRPTQIQGPLSGFLEAALSPVQAVSGLIKAANDTFPLVVKGIQDIRADLPLLESLRLAAVKTHQNKQQAVQTFSRSFLCHLSGQDSCREGTRSGTGHKGTTGNVRENKKT